MAISCQVLGSNKSTYDANFAQYGLLNEASLGIAEEVKAVALARTLLNPAATGPVIGARTFAQAQDNLGALDVRLDPDHVARLDAAGRQAPIFPQRFVERPLVQQLVFGGAAVERRGR